MGRDWLNGGRSRGPFSGWGIRVLGKFFLVISASKLHFREEFCQLVAVGRRKREQ